MIEEEKTITVVDPPLVKRRRITKLVNTIAKAEEARQMLRTSEQILKSSLVHDKIMGLYNTWQESQPPRGGLHASSVLSPGDTFCNREHVLGTKYVRKHPVHNPSTLAIFFNGWLIHEGLQRLFQLGGIAVEVEKPHLDARWKLHFTPDAIVDIDEELYICEIKGYRDSVCSSIDIMNPWKNKEYRKAHVQANLYMAMTGIHQAIILIINKNDQRVYTWVIDYDESLALPYINRMNILNDLVTEFQDRDRLVSRISECPDALSTRAKKCTMAAACFASREQRKLMEVQAIG